MDTTVEGVEVQTEQDAATLTDRDALAERRILQYTTGSMAVGIVPLPLVDLAVLAAAQLKMLHTLADIYGVEFKGSLGKAAVGSLIGGVLPIVSARPLAASLTKFVPVIGHALSFGSLVILSGASTYAVGKVFQQHFASGGTFLTFEPDSVRDYFNEQYAKGKEMVSSLCRKKEVPEAAPETEKTTTAAAA